MTNTPPARWSATTPDPDAVPAARSSQSCTKPLHPTIRKTSLARTHPVQALRPLLPAMNPSSWRNRLPVLLGAMAGLIIAVYLTLYQTAVIPTVWDPVFGRGSQRVLHSWI